MNRLTRLIGPIAAFCLLVAAPAEICAAPRILRSIEPDPALVERYRAGHARYRALYPALKET